MLDLAALKTPPGEYTIALYARRGDELSLCSDAVAAAEAARRGGGEERRSSGAGTEELTDAVKTAPPVKKAEVDKACKAMEAKQKVVVAKLAAASEQVKRATAAAEPKRHRRHRRLGTHRRSCSTGGVEMSKESQNQMPRTCPGSAAVAGSRRSFMQLGLAGMASLSLPGILRLQAERPLHAAESSKGSKEKTAVIMVWKPGGCSHIDSYDPKPDAGSEYADRSARSKPRCRGCASRSSCRGRRRSPTSSTCCARCIKRRRTSGRIDADALRRQRHARQAEAAAAGLDVGDELPALEARAAQSSAAALRGESTRRWNTTAPPTWATRTRRSRCRAIRACRRSPCRTSGFPTRRKSNASIAVRSYGTNLDTLERSFDRAGELAALDEFETRAMTLFDQPEDEGGV